MKYTVRSVSALLASGHLVSRASRKGLQRSRRDTFASRLAVKGRFERHHSALIPVARRPARSGRPIDGVVWCLLVSSNAACCRKSGNLLPRESA